jgi:CDP-paratose 2-epimerase
VRAVRILITGGAGFVGANLAIGLAARHPDWEIACLDNLHRRGSELNLPRLRGAGVAFIHGDVRVLEDLLAVDELEAILECSAEPSVMAGVGGSPDYLIGSNLLGAYHCLELARRRGAYFVFLSTSRIYPVAALQGLRLDESELRYDIAVEQAIPGAGPAGISETFPLDGARTMYGATKLAAELLIEEYRETYGLRGVVNRCGVITGPWQMGKVDQGVFTFWMLAHHFRRPLQYLGFEGSGKQVRDLLHIDDLLELVDEQLLGQSRWDGVKLNVGGGRECSLSLQETTALCTEITGNVVEVASVADQRPGDVPVYISDCSALAEHTGWRPRRTAQQTLSDIHAWVVEYESELASALQT